MAATQQGIAQRVLGAIPGNPKLTEFEAICCHAGAEEMLEELSAEARRVFEDAFDGDDACELIQSDHIWAEEHGGDHHVDGTPIDPHIQVWVDLDWFCQHLGLDLEGDDS